MRATIEAAASRDGLSLDAVRTYVKEASAIRNQDRPDLVLNHDRVGRFWHVADQAIASHSGAPVEQFIQDLVDRNTFNFKNVAPYQVVIKQTRRPAEGMTLREVFDATKNQYATLVRVNVANGEGYINGQRLTADQLERSALTDGSRISVANRMGKEIEFQFAGVRSLDLAKLKLASATATETVSNHRAIRCESALVQ